MPPALHGEVPERRGEFVLGTAQIGLGYGVANRTGKPQAEEVRKILETAAAAGVRIVDTAQSYGDSELQVGRWLQEDPRRELDVVTKLDPLVDPADAAAVLAAAERSCVRLGRPPVALLLHDPVALAREGVREAFQTCVEHGLAGAWGVSVYTPSEFEAAVAIDELTVIQAPFNVFDRRLLEQDLLTVAISRGTQLFLRSVLLQGVLLLEPAELPGELAFAARSLEPWRALCSRHGVDLLTGAIQFVRSAAPEAHVVVGCENAEQLDSDLAAFGRGAPVSFVADVEQLPVPDERLIDPRRWKPATL